MSAFATVDDYLTWVGQDPASATDAQRARIQMRLDGASALIRTNLPAGYEPDADLLKTTTLVVAERALINSGGRRSRTVGGVSETYDQDGGLYLADGELEALLSGWDEGSSGAYTVGLRDDAFPAESVRLCDTYAYRDRRELYGGRRHVPR
jgi:hypothetical protein